MWWPYWSLGPLHRNFGGGHSKMSVTFWLDEHGLFVEAGGEISVGLTDGIKDGFGKVAWDGSAASGWGVAVINDSHHQ